MKYSRVIKDYFTFNRREQRGISVLMTILLGLVLANALLPRVIPRKPVDFSEYEKEITAFEVEMRKMDSLNKSRNRQNTTRYSAVSYSMNFDSGKNFKPKLKETFIIELNAADTFELLRLRGIGSSFAKRIIKYRDRLGGYTDKLQLLEIWGMDTARFNGISAYLKVNMDSIHRIDINHVTFKDLLKHPYFPFEMTKAIFLYRKEQKEIRGLDELKNIKGINDSIFRKIKCYLKVR